MSKINLIIFAFIMTVQVLSGQISMAENMAATIMKEYQDSIVVKRYVNHLVLAEQAAGKSVPEPEKRPAVWNYEIGVVLTGFDRIWKSTGNPVYLKYTKDIIDHFISPDGKIRTYHMDEFNLDNIPSGRLLITLYQVYRDKKYLEAAKYLKYQLDYQPRTKQNGYWHKLRYPYQMWLDGLYMGQPFRTEYLLTTNNDSEWDDVINQFVLMANGARDLKTGLMYHAFDESKIQLWSNPIDGKSPEFWSRAMGWYMIGIIDVLENFPKEHPRRKELLSIFENLSRAILKYQDPVSKTWWQVTDKGGRQGNYLESSGSSMFVAAMLKGVRLGLLPKDIQGPAIQGYEGIVKEFITKDAEGTYHLNKAVGGAGLGGTPYRDGSYEYYIKEPTRSDDLKAVGPFIQAAVEYELAKKPKPGEGKIVLLDRFFNNEYRDGSRYHYTWEDKHDSGFSWFGQIFGLQGASIASLDGAPTSQNLAKAKVYVIVDPDHKKDNAKPNFINKDHISSIKKWVANGGSLLLMTNDTTNCDVVNVNNLAKVFGIEFTMKNINFVKNDHYPDGVIIPEKENGIFDAAGKLYIKELVTLKVSNKAKVIAKKGSDIVMASANYGKGKVFVIGDPWLYNEYVNGRKLPADYKNFEAAVALADWLVK
jgi:unsaturated rhamnogalacturonyl hydrolase